MEERPDRVVDDPWWRFGLVTVGTLFRATMKLRIEGLEGIPASGPAIIAANHVSPLDPIAMAIAASRRGPARHRLGSPAVPADPDPKGHTGPGRTG